MSAPAPAPEQHERFVVETSLSEAVGIAGSRYSARVHSTRRGAEAQAAVLNRRDADTGYTWRVYRMVVEEAK